MQVKIHHFLYLSEMFRDKCVTLEVVNSQEMEIVTRSGSNLVAWSMQSELSRWQREVQTNKSPVVSNSCFETPVFQAADKNKGVLGEVSQYTRKNRACFSVRLEHVQSRGRIDQEISDEGPAVSHSFYLKTTGGTAHLIKKTNKKKNIPIHVVDTQITSFFVTDKHWWQICSRVTIAALGDR